MTNDVSDTNPEDAVPCFALSKNDSYVMSASGGKISLFNMMTFKVDRWPSLHTFLIGYIQYSWLITSAGTWQTVMM
jgi:hypothetical protein